MTTVNYPHIITSLCLLLLLSQLSRAQPSPPGRNPDDPSYGGGSFSPSMGVVIIVLIAVLFFMGFLSIYIRHCTDNPSTNGVATGRRLGSIRRSRRAPRGLNLEVIESFPTFDYAAVKSEKLGKGALECAVCLTEFEDDDTLRLIPKCDHVFHPDCIDAWLVGHTTCPVCRCNLSDAAVTGEHAPVNDVVIEVGQVQEEDNNNSYSSNNNNNHYDENVNESMEQPLHGRITRNRTMRNLSFGRPRSWLGKYARSLSTGHVEVKQWENYERFTLRLPEEVRKQIMSGKLERTTSLLVLPRESSSRRGYRTGFSEGSSRGRVDRAGRSDRWVFSLAPPFFTRAPSIKSPKVAVANNAPKSRGGSLRGSGRENVTTTTSSRDGSVRGAIQAELTQLPV